MLCIRACHGWYPVQTVERWGTHCAILQSTKGHWASGALRRPGREVIDISLAIKSFNRIIRSHLKERECDSCESKASGTETERDSNKKISWHSSLMMMMMRKKKTHRTRGLANDDVLVCNIADSIKCNTKALICTSQSTKAQGCKCKQRLTT